MKYFWICSLLILIIESCTIQKRHHLPGYHVHFHHKFSSENSRVKKEEVSLRDSNSYVIQSDTLKTIQNIKEKQLIVDQTTVAKLDSILILKHVLIKNVSISDRQTKLDEIEENLDEKRINKINQDYTQLKILSGILFALFRFSITINPAIFGVNVLLTLISLFILFYYKKKYGKYLKKKESSISANSKSKQVFHNYYDRKKAIFYYIILVFLIGTIVLSLITLSKYFIFNIYVVLPFIIPLYISLLIFLYPKIKFENTYNPKIIDSKRLFKLSIIFNFFAFIMFAVCVQNPSYLFFPLILIIYLGISLTLSLLSLWIKKKNNLIFDRNYYALLMLILLILAICITIITY